MSTHHVRPDGLRSGARPTCPHCGSQTIRTIPVPWYPELEYLSCDACHHVWTVKRTSKDDR